MPDTAPPADGAALTSSYLQTMLREQVIRTVTSSTRPTGVEGAVIYETDTDLVYVYNGSAWTLAPVLPSAWTAVTFTNSWVNYNASNSQCAYRKVGDTVQVRGLMKDGTLSLAAFTLPTGFRPTLQLNIATVSNSAFGYITITSAGAVIPIGGSTAFYSVDNIQFSTI